MNSTLVTKKDYDNVLKLAYKFAYNNDSIEYERYVAAGVEGLAKAVRLFNPDKGMKFSSYAFMCARDAMCTQQKLINRFPLQKADGVDLAKLDGLMETITEDNMVETVKKVILKANNQNQRNADIFMMNIGLQGDEPMEYKDLAVKYQMSSERIRQICVNTRKQIKQNKSDMDILYSFVG